MKPFWEDVVAVKHLKVLSLATSLMLWAFPAYAADPPFSLPTKSELLKLRSAKIITNKGELDFELFPREAPWHVANFKYLADKDFYRNLSFNQFYPGYIIQGGEPTGRGGPGYSIPAEFSRHSHEEGTLGMARRKDFMNPERRSHGSQFHILLGKAGHMDGSYTVFGKLIRGYEVLRTLRRGDVIREVRVYVKN